MTQQELRFSAPPAMVPVLTLTPMEIRHGTLVAVERFLEMRALGVAPNAWGKPQSLVETLARDILGACGEEAFSKLTDRYFHGHVNKFHQVADVSAAYEVRTTDQEDGSLIIRSYDDDDRFFVLVVGMIPTFRVVGFIQAGEAKQEKWVRAPHGKPPAWFVPQSALRAVLGTIKD